MQVELEAQTDKQEKAGEKKHARMFKNARTALEGVRVGASAWLSGMILGNPELAFKFAAPLILSRVVFEYLENRSCTLNLAVQTGLGFVFLAALDQEIGENVRIAVATALEFNRSLGYPEPMMEVFRRLYEPLKQEPIPILAVFISARAIFLGRRHYLKSRTKQPPGSE